MLFNAIIAVLVLQTPTTGHIEHPAQPRAYEILPEDRGGQDMIGTILPEPAFGEFSSPLTLAPLSTSSLAPPGSMIRLGPARLCGLVT